MKDRSVSLRQAAIEDIAQIVEMLADDRLGAQRERSEEPLPESYYRAFYTINDDPNNELIVAIVDTEIAGCMQIIVIPSLTFQGRPRVQIEGVRVSSKYRNQGIGKIMMQWAIDRAKIRNCHVVQLTTDKKRPEAKMFYESLGFQATHDGMKLFVNI